MVEVRGEVGVRESFNKKLMRSRWSWAGHVDRMGHWKLAERDRDPETQRHRDTET